MVKQEGMEKLVVIVVGGNKDGMFLFHLEHSIVNNKFMLNMSNYVFNLYNVTE